MYRVRERNGDGGWGEKVLILEIQIDNKMMKTHSLNQNDYQTSKGTQLKGEKLNINSGVWKTREGGDEKNILQNLPANSKDKKKTAESLQESH